MSLSPETIDAMLAAGVTAEQMAKVMKAEILAQRAAAEKAVADERARADAKADAKRLRETEKKRKQRAAAKALSPPVPGDTGGQDGTDGDIGGRKDARVHEGAPAETLTSNLPKEDTPSEAKASDAPKGARSRKKPKGVLCPDGLEPHESHFAKADAGGRDRRYVYGVRDRMHRWSHANANRDVAYKTDWHLALHDFLDKAMAEAPQPSARGSPGNVHQFSRQGPNQVLAEFMGMTSAPEHPDPFQASHDGPDGPCIDHEGDAGPRGALQGTAGGNPGRLSAQVYRLAGRAQ